MSVRSSSKSRGASAPDAAFPNWPQGLEDADAVGEDYNVDEADDGPRPFTALLDTGLKRTSTGSKVFAALKVGSRAGIPQDAGCLHMHGCLQRTGAAAGVAQIRGDKGYISHEQTAQHPASTHWLPRQHSRPHAA